LWVTGISNKIVFINVGDHININYNTDGINENFCMVTQTMGPTFSNTSTPISVPVSGSLTTGVFATPNISARSKFTLDCDGNLSNSVEVQIVPSGGES